MLIPDLKAYTGTCPELWGEIIELFPRYLLHGRILFCEQQYLAAAVHSSISIAG